MNERENILPRAFDVLPKIGDGATLRVGSDSYAYTVIDVKKRPKRSVITIQQATAKATGDYYGHQTYDITPNPNGKVLLVTWQQGGWHEKGKDYIPVSFHPDGPGYEYSDPTF